MFVCVAPRGRFFVAFVEVVARLRRGWALGTGIGASDGTETHGLADRVWRAGASSNPSSTSSEAALSRGTNFVSAVTVFSIMCPWMPPTTVSGPWRTQSLEAGDATGETADGGTLD